MDVSADVLMPPKDSVRPEPRSEAVVVAAQPNPVEQAQQGNGAVVAYRACAFFGYVY